MDTKLKYDKHIEHITATCYRELAILEFLAYVAKGAHPQFLFNIFKSLIRSQIDYGSVLFNNLYKIKQQPIEITEFCHKNLSRRHKMYSYTILCAGDLLCYHYR